MKNLPRTDYYQIGLLSDASLEKSMKLSIFPAPDTEIRKMFYFKPLKTKIRLEEPVDRD